MVRLSLPDRPFGSLPGRTRNSLNASLLDGYLWALMFGLGEMFVVPFAVLFNASALLVSLINGVAQMSVSVSNILGAHFIQYYRKRKTLAIITNILHAVSYLFLFGLTLLTKDPVIVLIFFTAGVMCSSFAGSGWFTWMNDLVPPRFRGRFWGLRNKYQFLPDIRRSSRRRHHDARQAVRSDALGIRHALHRRLHLPCGEHPAPLATVRTSHDSGAGEGEAFLLQIPLLPAPDQLRQVRALQCLFHLRNQPYAGHHHALPPEDVEGLLHRALRDQHGLRALRRRPDALLGPPDRHLRQSQDFHLHLRGHSPRPARVDLLPERAGLHRPQPVQRILLVRFRALLAELPSGEPSAPDAPLPDRVLQRNQQLLRLPRRCYGRHPGTERTVPTRGKLPLSPVHGDEAGDRFLRLLSLPSGSDPLSGPVLQRDQEAQTCGESVLCLHDRTGPGIPQPGQIRLHCGGALCPGRAHLPENPHPA